MQVYSLSQKKIIEVPDAGVTPSVQTPAVQPSTPVAPPESFGSSIGNGIINIGKSIVKPFVDTGKNIATAAITIPQAAEATAFQKVASTPWAKALYERMGIDPQAIADKIANADVGGTATRAKEISADPEKAMRQQIGNSAQIASWAVPFSKEAGFVKGALIPGAEMGAMSSGGRTMAQEKTSLPEVLGNTALGGVTGAATAGTLYGLGKLPDIVGGKLTKESEAITAKNLNMTPSQIAKFYKQTGQTLPDFIKEQGLQGADFSKIEEAIAKKQDLFDSVASNPDLTVSGKDIINGLQKEADTLSKSTIPANVSKANTVKEIIDKFKTQYGEGDLTGDVVTSLRREVDQAVKDFGADSVVRSPLNTYRTVLQDSVRNAADEQGLLAGDASLKTAGEELHKFYQLSDLAENRQFIGQGSALKIGGKDAVSAIVGSLFGGPVGAVGGVVANRALQTPIGNRVISGITGTAGNILQKELPPVIQSAIPKIAVQGATALENPNTLVPENINQNNNQNNGQNTSDSNHVLPPVTSINQNQPDVKQTTYISGHSPEEIYGAMQKAQAAGDTKAVSELRQMYVDETAYQKANPSGNQAVNPTAVEGLDQLTAYEKEMGFRDANGNKLNKPNFQKGKILAGKFDPSTELYETYAYNIARDFLMAKVGRAPTEEQIKMAQKNVLPGYFDSPEQAQTKLDNLRNTLENYKLVKPTTDSLPDVTAP